MSAKVYEVRLTAKEIKTCLDALESALAGEYDAGDLCWDESEAEGARRASDKLKEVQP